MSSTNQRSVLVPALAPQSWDELSTYDVYDVYDVMSPYREGMCSDLHMHLRGIMTNYAYE